MLICTQFKSLGVWFFVCLHLRDNVHSPLDDMEIIETKRFIPKRFELGTRLS